MHRKINIIQPDTDVFLIIDPQNDLLLPNGAWSVPNGEKIIQPILRIKPFFKRIIITIRSFPNDHYSFKENGGNNPKHCLMGSFGGEIIKEISKGLFKKEVEIVPGRLDEIGSQNIYYSIIRRGVNLHKDPSDIFNNGLLAIPLKKCGAKRIFLCGLPLEEGVKDAALGFKEFGFDVVIFEDAVKSRNKNAGISAKQDLQMAGIHFMNTCRFFEE